MDKKTLSIVCLVMFLLYTTRSFTQNDKKGPYLIRFDVGELYKESDIARYTATMGFSFQYEGPLVNGIAHLIQTPFTRIKVEGDVPKKTIYYKSDLAITDVIDSKSLILKTLQYYYKFKIYEVEDSIDFWVLKQLDNTKLQVHSLERDGPGISAVVGVFWGAIDMSVSSISTIVEQIVKVATDNETHDNRHYNIPNIPVALMKKDKFDELNVLLRETHGLEFVKEKRLEKLKLIKFEN